MRLLTHNMLSSNIKGVTNDFPLRIEVQKVIEKPVDFNPDFLRHMFPKIDWNALVGASQTMGYPDLPDSADAAMLDSDDFLRRFHHSLLKLHLEEGALLCPKTSRRFPVIKGIPNMHLHEDELQEPAV
ncbi:multifunctional methyltransferase subunit TRM112 homolog A-like [Camellia sinensis]|uniref:multifunctional methyltransferase subunit TRM112 homolog A-like n=1 Tax=Camellia sinensis TaxID=4442 RepID=UPI0010368725|nr:multifunctional methyltransferase subunit TRM112 homolog A-like [Camellia sinensis]